MTHPVIELNKVSKRFGTHQVLNDLDLSVPEGSVFAFLGNNGAGKSTTIRLITGLLQADQGEVRVLGKNIRTDRMAILQQLGCIVDSPSLYPNLSASEFLRIGCAIKKLPLQEIDRVLEVVNLREAGQTRVAHYSLGMKQRLALAHALLGSPALLILDEPTNGLDPQGIHEIRHLLKNLPEIAACSIFISSHQLDEVEKMASHLALLKDGRIFCQTSVAQWLATQTGVLSVEIDDAERAITILQTLGYAVQKVDAQHITVTQIAARQADRLHTGLIQAGIRLFQSVYQKPSLEDWFLQNTGGRAGADRVGE